MTRKLLIGLGVLTLATPLGLLARGTAWGEWAAAELSVRLGFVPRGLAEMEKLWTPRLAGYQFRNAPGSLSYLGSAILGVLVLLLAGWLVGRWLAPSTPRRKISFFERTLAGAHNLLYTFFVLEDTPGRGGLLQRVDPRVKLVTLLTPVILSTFSHSLPALSALYTATIALAILSRLPLARFLARTWLFVPLFTAAVAGPALLRSVTPGHVIGEWGPVAITAEGVHLAEILVLRAATAVSWTLLLVLTTRWIKLFAALQVLGVPRTFVWTLQMMLSYLQRLVRQLEEFQWAIKSRALAPMNVRQGQRVVTSHMGVLFQRSLMASEETFAALRSRGYNGEPATSRWKSLYARDYGWVAAWSLGVLGWGWCTWR